MNFNISQVPGFPETRRPFDDWLANLPANHAFKPMKVNGCIVALFLQSLWKGTLVEDTSGILHFNVVSPLDPAEGIIGVRVQAYGIELFPILATNEPERRTVRPKLYSFSGTWIEDISGLQWNLGISASQAEREYRTDIFRQYVQRQHLANCLQISMG